VAQHGSIQSLNLVAQPNRSIKSSTNSPIEECMIRKKLLSISSLFLFCLTVGVIIFSDRPVTLDFASKGKKGGKLSQRSLDPAIIENQLDSIPDEPSALFNDPAVKQAWGIKKSDAARAWSITQGSREIIVAVIDTGLDVKHEDIFENLWINRGEIGKDAWGRDKATNGIDDDSNGCIDDVYGCNFITMTGDLTDNHGHGTHISGIIGAMAGNGKGIIGLAPQVSLMTLKYFDPKVPQTDHLKNTIAAINYAVDMGAHIINYSGGGTEFSQDEKEAIARAQRKGILFVAAAGNEKSNSDRNPYYPADYKLPNIISVTAIDPSTEVLITSNWGVESVDIAAPGQNILSLLPNNSYGYLTGTSQATAFVTGAAALVMTKRENFQAEQVKKYILSTGDAMSSLAGKTATSRKLNMFKALTILDADVSVSGLAHSGGKAVEIPRTTSDQKELSGFASQLLQAVKKEDSAPPKRPLPKKERLAERP
jgi:subtilisin family serine protease